MPQKNVTKRLVENMLTNPFYVGYLPTRGSRKPAKKGAHKPLIEMDLWDQVQKIKGIRAAQHQGFRKNILAKPLMGLFKCGVCEHSVTGESHKKASGKVYIHYHCANPKCDQRRINTPQEKLLQQIEYAFEPFAHFTAKATKAFTDSLQGRLKDLDFYTQKMSGELAGKRLAIKEAIERLEKLHEEGRLTDEEFSEVMRIKESALAEVKLEIDAYNEADYQTFNQGLRLIELFTSIRNYMRTPGNELEKVRLTKLVLSNPKLKDGTIEFCYQKPFDVLLDLTSNKNWWTRTSASRTLIVPTATCDYIFT
ncbi:MAG: recombinase family protein [Bdellovibrionales bacterium]|nr:recombinase family protein [Bdellovibrionales bacterium]